MPIFTSSHNFYKQKSFKKLSKLIGYSLNNFDGHLEAKILQEMLFLGSMGSSFDQFLISIFPINFIFDIEIIIISGPQSYLDRI